MKKNRLFALLMAAVLMIGTLAACSSSSSTQTLEDYAASHAEVQEEIDSTFADSGLEGTVTIEGNNILMTVDITSLLGEGIELDDSTKDLLVSSFDGAFDESEEELQSAIADIEKETKISGITMQVVVVYGSDTVYDRTFSAA